MEIESNESIHQETAMKDRPLYYSSNKRGPSVKATFFISEKGVEKVTLHSPSQNDGFEYEIIETQPATQVSGLVEKWIESYCKGRQPKNALPIVLDGLPPYTTRVLSILRDVPIGVTLSYRELAEVTDNPLGARAVGNACARNPCPLIIPCHRVLATGGGIGGFTGGLSIKKNLLRFEGVS